MDEDNLINLLNYVNILVMNGYQIIAEDFLKNIGVIVASIGIKISDETHEYIIKTVKAIRALK